MQVLVPLPQIPQCVSLYDFELKDEGEKDCLSFKKVMVDAWHIFFFFSYDTSTVGGGEQWHGIYFHMKSVHKQKNSTNMKSVHKEKKIAQTWNQFTGKYFHICFYMILY